MADIFLHKRPVSSVFTLLGENENDVTFTIGWALSQSSSFLHRFLNKVVGQRYHDGEDPFVISLQEFSKMSGITDIEIRSADTHLIVEAKRGWEPPSETQLRKYLPRFRTKAKRKLFVTMAECPKDYTSIRLPSQLGRIPIRHLSWKDIALLSDLSEGSHAEKRLMAELRKYLATIVTMQKQDSNWVYVVALNNEKWAGNLSYIEIVEKRRKYFHPRGINGWPKEPPNYIAFRYWGKLQQICHVEDAKVIDNFHPYFPESPNQKLDSPHWLYELGKPIFPQGVVRTGKIYASGRKWAMLDLLLTSRTIAAACKASKLREQKI